MAETINDRMEMLINSRFNGNKSAFAKLIGLAPTGLSNYLGKKRRSKPNVDMVTKIITAIDVDARWLLTGEETPKQEHFEQHGDHTLMAKTIQHLEIDQRNIGEQKETDVHAITEETVLPPDCPDEKLLHILQLQVGLLNRLIAEKDERITELKERIEDLKKRMNP